MKLLDDLMKAGVAWEPAVATETLLGSAFDKWSAELSSRDENYFCFGLNYGVFPLLLYFSEYLIFCCELDVEAEILGN